MIIFGLLITGFLTMLPLAIPSVLATTTAQEQDEERRQDIEASLARRGFTADLNQILAQNQSIICDIDNLPAGERETSTLVMDTVHEQAARVCYYP